MSYGNLKIRRRRDFYKSLEFQKYCFAFFGCLVGHWDEFGADILDDGYRPNRIGDGIEKKIRVRDYTIVFCLTDGWNYVLDRGWLEITTKTDAENELSDHPSYSWNAYMRINRKPYSLAAVYGSTFPFPNRVRKAVLSEIANLKGYGLVFTAQFDEPFKVKSQRN